MENLVNVFETDNIIYVKPNKQFINDYLTMVNDPLVQMFITHHPKVYTYEDEMKWIEEKIKNDDLLFTMIEKDTLEFIGNIEIMEINNNIGELGIAITVKMQNKHYGTEALKGIINYGFNELNLDGLELNVYKINERAIHLYEKVGFTFDKTGKTEEDLHYVLKKYRKEN